MFILKLTKNQCELNFPQSQFENICVKMTKIICKTGQKNTFKYIIIKDHANYAEKGQDIVCAAISAITNGTINFLQLNYKNDCQISYLSSKISIYPTKS